MTVYAYTAPAHVRALLPRLLCNSACTYFFRNLCLLVRFGSVRFGLLTCSPVQLGGVEAYRVLSASGCTELDGVDDAAQFEGVRAACGTIGLDEGMQMQVGARFAGPIDAVRYLGSTRRCGAV